MKNCQQLFSNSSVVSSPVLNCGVWIGDAAPRVNGVVTSASFEGFLALLFCSALRLNQVLS